MPISAPATTPLLPPERAQFPRPLRLSVVVPVYDEEGSLPALYERLAAVLPSCAGEGGFEIVFIDDGSRDGSWAVIERLHAAAGDRVVALRHRRNFGKAAALATGFRVARGDFIVTLDADLQDQPEEISRLLAPLESGEADLVSGWKRHRRDPLDKTLPSRVFNFIARLVSGLSLHDFNCGFKAYRAPVAKNLNLYGELHRFIPILAHAEGFRVREVAVAHQPRRHGRSKFGADRLAKGALDLLTTVLLTRYLRRPAHFFGGLGLLAGVFGVGVLGYLSLGWFLGEKGIAARPLFFFGILATLLSAQLVSFGLIAELLLSRTARGERSGLVSERLGAAPKEDPLR
jgi:glycosyltransferase involved in cell wall biosynthesis